MQALQKEGVSAAAIQSLLSEVDRDNNCRIDYDEVCGEHKRAQNSIVQHQYVLCQNL